MLKDTMKTRRSHILDGFLSEMESPSGDLPTSITQNLLEHAYESADSINEYKVLHQVSLSWRMHQSLHRLARSFGHEELFTVFLDSGDEMLPFQAKAMFGRGDYGELVLTFGMPEETVEFGGAVTRIRADYLLYLSNFMGKEGDPSYRIEVTPHPSGGVILCATADACMGLLRDPGAYCQTPFFFTPSKKLLGECKTKYGESARYLILDQDRATVETSQGRVVHIEPNYPVSEHADLRWQDILKRSLDSATHSPVLNAPVSCTELARFFANIPGGNSAFRLYCAGTEDVIVVRIAGLPDFVGLIAPVRINGFGPIWPDWLGHLNQKEFTLDDFMEKWTQAIDGAEAVTQ